MNSSKVRRALCWVLLALFAQPVWAGGGTPPPSPPDPAASTPGEEVTSLPMIQDVGGLTFVGRLRELRHLGLSVRGHGRIVVQRLDRHTLAVTFFGDYLVDVDRAALARSGVAIFFRGGVPFHGGLARLQVGDSEPVLLPADRVPLPVVRLAGNQRAQGSLVTLDVRATNGRKAHVEASFSRDRVTLAQRLQ